MRTAGTIEFELTTLKREVAHSAERLKTALPFIDGQTTRGTVQREIDTLIQLAQDPSPAIPAIPKE